ncbi:MAG: hypothetical protein HKO90_09460 [Flavobacteriaceae bacterium]|nr:hypothetical protein [Flavobacteriaceae bacterium]
MAQDLRKLFENERQLISNQGMPEGHEARFVEKLDSSLPMARKRYSYSFFRIAAGFLLLVSLGYLGFRFFSSDSPVPQEVSSAKTLEEISPELKKVEDYYLASINHELSKLRYTSESKELFDGYVKRLDELSSEYERLSKELIQSGPNEQTVSALIDNLKMRLELLYRLKEKLNELNIDVSIEDHQG